MRTPDMAKLTERGIVVAEELRDEGFTPGMCMAILAVSMAAIACVTEGAKGKDISRGFATIMALAAETYTKATGDPCEITSADLEFAKNLESKSARFH